MSSFARERLVVALIAQSTAAQKIDVLITELLRGWKPRCETAEPNSGTRVPENSGAGNEATWPTLAAGSVGIGAVTVTDFPKPLTAVS